MPCQSRGRSFPSMTLAPSHVEKVSPLGPICSAPIRSTPISQAISDPRHPATGLGQSLCLHPPLRDVIRQRSRAASRCTDQHYLAGPISTWPAGLTSHVWRLSQGKGDHLASKTWMGAESISWFELCAQFDMSAVRRLRLLTLASRPRCVTGHRG